ncbi:MAG TPA: hypothetical protein VMS30_07740 [Phycisphaerales bacterium]|nr:hypothetical protein [Phycisphaerales bacterium]
MPSSPAAPRLPERPALAEHRSAVGCLARARGGFLILSALAVGILGWLVLHLLAGSLHKDQDLADQVSAFGRWMIDHRAMLPMAVLPALAAGAWSLLRPVRATGDGKSRPMTPWIVTGIATVWLLAIFAAILITFVLFLAPLYQYRDLG